MFRCGQCSSDIFIYLFIYHLYFRLKVYIRLKIYITMHIYNQKRNIKNIENKISYKQKIDFLLMWNGACIVRDLIALDFGIFYLFIFYLFLFFFMLFYLFLFFIYLFFYLFIFFIYLFFLPVTAVAVASL